MRRCIGAFYVMGTVQGVSEWLKSGARKTRDKTLYSLRIRPSKMVMTEGEFGDVPAFAPSLTFMPGRFHAITADDMPAGLKSETRQLYRVATPANFTFRTASNSPRYKVEQKDRLVIGDQPYDVLGIYDSPAGDGLVDYIFVAKVIS